MAANAELNVLIRAKDELSSVVRGARKEIEGMGRSMQRAGSAMTRSVTLPLVGVAAASLKVGAEFEKSFSKIEGLVGVPREELQGMSQDTLDLAVAAGVGPNELAEALFFVTSAGFRGADAMNVLEMAAKASTAGLGETATIADAVTSAVNAYGIENLSAGQATDVLTAAVREGKLEASALAPTLGRLLPTASALGISFEDVAGTMAVMSRTGLNAAESSTSLNGVMSALLKPSEDARKALGEVGLTFGDLQKTAGEDGLVAVFRLLEQEFEGNNDALARVFPNVEALRAAMNALSQDGETVDSVLNGVKNSTGALDDAFKAASETFDFQWNQAIAQGQVLLIELFDVIREAALPVLQSLTQALQQAVTWFQNLSPQAQQVIIVVAALAAAVGPLLLVLGTLLTVLPAIGAALALLVSPIGLVIAAVVLLGLAFATNFMGIRDVVMNVVNEVIVFFQNLGAAFMAFIETIRPQWDAFMQAILAAWQLVGPTVTAIAQQMFIILQALFQTFVAVALALWTVFGQNLVAVFQFLWTALQATVEFALTFMTGLINAFIALITGDWAAFGQAIGQMWDATWQLVTTIASAALTLIQSLFQNFVQLLSSLWDAFGAHLGTVWQAAWQIIQTVFQAAINVIQSNWQSFVAFVTSLWTTFTNFLSSTWEAVWNTIESILAGAVSVLQSAISGFQNFWNSVWSAIRNGIEGFIAPIRSTIETILNPISTVRDALSGLRSFASTVSSKVGSVLEKGKGLVGLGGDQFGGVTPFTRLRLVGEAGPELVRLPAGAQVNDAAATQRLLGSGGGGASIVVHQTINSPTPLTPHEIRKQTERSMRLIALEARFR